MTGDSTPKASQPDTLRFHIVAYLLCVLAGIAGGWVVWGKPTKNLPAQQKKALHERKVVDSKHTDPNALPVAPSIQEGATRSLAKCFEALAIIDPDLRLAEFLAALRQMQPADAPVLFKRFKEEFRPEKTPNREWEAFLHRWGEIAPTDSLAYAMSRDTSNAQGYFLKFFLEGWARADSTAATQWLNEHSEVPQWDGAFVGLLRGKASRDPWAATKTALASIPDDGDWLCSEVAPYLAAAIMRRGGADELIKWFATIPTQTVSNAKFKEKAMHGS